MAAITEDGIKWYSQSNLYAIYLMQYISCDLLYIAVKPSKIPLQAFQASKEQIPGDDFSVLNDVPYLETLEESKRKVQRTEHDQESFWSWFYFRICCCDCYLPSAAGVDCCRCCYGCVYYCSCNDCDCSCCSDCICPADAEICATCGESVCTCCSLC